VKPLFLTFKLERTVMKRGLFTFLFILFFYCHAFSQVAGNEIIAQQGGNSVYSDANRKRQEAEAPTGEVSYGDNNIMIEVNVLMNVKAEEYVTTFSVSQECASVMECNEKIDTRIAGFITSLKGLGIESGNIFVDFVTQNRIYDYDLAGNVAKEKQVGFEVKKNILIYYKDKDLTDRLVTAASQFGIYDLVKVDYLIQDTSGIKKRLLDDALKIVKEKEAKYSDSFGYKFRAHVLIEREKYNIHYPTQMYSSYSAYETGRIVQNNPAIANYVNVNSKANGQYRIQEARKSTTFFYDPLNANGFDHIINPIINEPVVQFTLLLKIKYEIDR
jgi:uncharacterized protein YggE